MSSQPPNPPFNLSQCVSHFFQTFCSSNFNLFSRLNNSTLPSSCSSSPPLSLLFSDAPVLPLSLPSTGNADPAPSSPPSSAAIKTAPSNVRMRGSVTGNGAGPAFVGQVYSMCDPSGTGLMAVTTRFDVPFLSKRTSEWLKKMFSIFTNNEKNGPVFRFFMDLDDAVGYVKRFNIPTGTVGVCRLDVAYEHFKEKPHLFEFVPNKKQVKEANKLLKKISRSKSRRRLEGVPVFTARNLNIAIATVDGIKWYTPYFFDKGLLDNILETSIDQHFHILIKNRRTQRRRDVIDDSLATEMIEENRESIFEPPEVHEVLDEMGHPTLPLSVISKAAEIQLLDVVDNVLLGNKWLRKATGIQPKFPYLVDSFEERSAASFLKATESTRSSVNSGVGAYNSHEWQSTVPGTRPNDKTHNDQDHSRNIPGFGFPFGNWFSKTWSKPAREQKMSSGLIDRNGANTRMVSLDADCFPLPPNPLLPKITMVGISTGEGGQVSRASLKKTIQDLTKELEQAGHSMSEQNQDKDPLFVANVGDFSSITKTSSV